MLLRVYKDEAIQGNRVSLLKRAGVSPPRQIFFAGESVSIVPTIRYQRWPVKASLTTENKDDDNEDLPLGVSQQVYRRLRLPEQSVLNVRLNRGDWHLGPCLGVYVRVESSRRHPFGEQTKLLKQMSLMARASGVDLVVIGPGFSRTQNGWRYVANDETWVEQSLPMPDIIFRRSGAFRPKDARAVLADLRSFAADGRLHTLPRSFSNKWRLHQVLRQNMDLRPYLLRTHLVTNPEDLYRLATTIKDVYVKPLTGAQGNLIFHLKVVDKGLQVLWERRKKGIKARDIVEEVCKDNKEFTDFWKTAGPKRCIVQETFLLPETEEGYPFDLRWLIQYVPDPYVVARVARAGKAGSVTTNIHTGGRPIDAYELLEELDWANTSDLIAQVDEVALAVAEECRLIYGPIAELGVDLAVSKTGEIRVFEVNSTPGRRMLRLISPGLREMSLQYLLEYAINATGFAGES